MGTFAYAPGIRVHVESEKSGIIDVSGDITDWNVTRRSNTVSSFNFTLQNTQRKYDGLFWPGDRITVELKRITWVRVFTGTLNTSPVFSAWPRALPMSASCSLKKLQFWPWDPTTQAANAMVAKWVPLNAANSQTKGDGGLSNLVVDALVSVTNWNPKAIHIGEVPATWFKWAEDIERNIDLKASMQAVLGSSAIIGGSGLSSQIKLPASFVGLVDEQLQNAVAIYSNVLQYSGLSSTKDQDLAAKLSIMCALQESSLLPKPNPDAHGSMGLFQQTPPDWGSAAEVTDVAYATKAFLGVSYPKTPPGLFEKPNWRTLEPGAVIQSVQHSAPGAGAYSQWEGRALAIVIECRRQLGSLTVKGIDTGATNAGLPPGVSATPTVSTGTSLAATAANLINSRPPGSIRYSQVGTDAPQTASPTVLDCSSLVEWCFYHATGTLLNHRTSETQWAFCGPARQISLETAKSVQGALLFGDPEAGGTYGHVGVSLGNGYHVAAHMAYPDVTKDVNISLIDSGGFVTAALLPNLDYSNSGTTADAVKAITQITKKTANLAAGSISTSNINPGSSAAIGTGTSTDPFQALVKVMTTNQQVSGNIFGGPRKLINNQPFLPWIKNMVNSSMRAFSSAPNGDFMAWFPDYFDITGTCAKMVIQTIELMDFTVEWSDQQIVTHEFVTGSLVAGLDQASGSVVSADNNYPSIYQMLLTNGIATMDFPEIFKAIYGHSANPKFLKDYLQRFGARPNVDSMPNIQHGQMEFCMALWNFMYYWAAQFNANIPMTFMPELWPGMIIQIPEYNFQAYVTEVSHQGSFGSGGQFTTTATIVAPALIDESQRSSMFGMFADILATGSKKL